jgi:TonB family protein
MTPNFFDSPDMQRIGWALLHFLWQGALIALALKGAMMLLERRSSRLRYALALASLLLMAALPVFLLCKPQGSSFARPPAYEAIQFGPTYVTVSTAASVPIHSKPEFRATFFRLVTPLVPWMAAFWLIGMAILLLKTIGGVIQVQRLKRKAAAHCETNGEASLLRLAARARVADVPVLESNLVSIPTVVGWFKPAVLLPQGALNKFDRPILDALVAHELAHIRRHDCVVNLFQTVIEDLLFFHPAVWWASKRVRAEREACCDDDAVAICGDALVYVRALSQAEQFRSSLPVIALNSSPLLQRIRRLTEMRISKSNHITAFCIALLAVSFIVATAAGSILLATIPPQSSDKSDPKTQGAAESSKKAIGVSGQASQIPAPRKGDKGAIVGGVASGVGHGVPGVVVVDPKSFIEGQAKSMAISGRIYDPTSAVVPGVSVLLRNGATFTQLQNSDAEGRYEISMVCPSDADLVFRMPGFLPSIYSCKTLKSGALDVTLALGQANTQVEISVLRLDSVNRTSVNQPVRVHTGIREPQLILKKMPIYPQEAIMQNIEGTVELKCFVDVEGMVKYTRIIKGDPILAQAAIDAVKQWKYSPAIINDEPWPNEVSVILVFKME